MGDSVAILITIGLVIVTVALLAFGIVRLRRETRLSARTVVLGAVLPVIATIAYLVLGQPPFSPIVVGVVGLLGGLLGLAVAAVTRIDSRNGGVVVRQTGATLAIWTVVYVITALAGFMRSVDAQAVAALALAASAGLAAGSQFGLFMRARSRVSQATPAATFAWAGAPTSSAAPSTYSPPAA